MAKQLISFKKLGSTGTMSSSGLIKGCTYFVPKTGLIHIATSTTGYDTFGPTITIKETNGTELATIKMGDTTYSLKYVDSWRPITDSIRLLDSNTSASATAVKSAFDRADEAFNLANTKTSNAGTVTKISTGTGLTGGDITSSGTISINSTYQTYISNGNAAYSYFSNGVANNAARLSTTNKSIWGQTYWNSNGVPQDVTGAMSNVTNITMSGYIKMGDATISYDSTQKCIKFNF